MVRLITFETRSKTCAHRKAHKKQGHRFLKLLIFRNVSQLEHEVDTYKADSSAQQKSISELEQQKRQLADDLQALPPPISPLRT